jgi:predicted MFS family arabinose efflux permease
VRWSWRSTQWFMVIYGWVVFTVMVLLMPETANNLEEMGPSMNAPMALPRSCVSNMSEMVPALTA